jgi:hypothetical protein
MSTTSDSDIVAMLGDHRVKVDSGLPPGRDIELHAECIEGPQDQIELCGGLSALKLRDPLSSDFRTFGESCLSKAKVKAATAHNACEITDQVSFHEMPFCVADRRHSI